MAARSNIEWTEATWNPVTGCSKISAGCQNCYAERLARRLQAMGAANYKHGFHVALHEKTLYLPLTWKKPQIIFVNSMSDLFHEDVPLDFILSVFDVMQKANWHRYQILTKRSERMLSLDPLLPWKPHIWMGVTVERQDYAFRIDHLRKTRSYLKFLSMEPLLGPMEGLNLDSIGWIIVGGESGYKARPIDPSWVIGIRDQCLAAKVPFFFKQWGGVHRKRNGRKLEGHIWNQLPQSRKILKVGNYS